MGLEQVIDEVRRGGDGEAEGILAQAQKEADAILSEARERVDALRAKRLAAADREAEQIQTQVASSAEFEARKLALTAEAKLRERLRGVLLDGFAALPADVRQGHLEKLLAKASQVIPEGSVWTAEADQGLLPKVAGADAFELAADAADIRGGLLVESKDGTIRLDLSYETLLDDLWRDVLKAEAGLFD